MNRVFWAWVLMKVWKIDMKVLQKKDLIGNNAEFENDVRLNREPVNRFQKWDRMVKPRRLCDNPS